MRRFIPICLFWIMTAIMTATAAPMPAPDDEHVIVGHLAERDTALQAIAQEAANNYVFKVGDTVIISKSQTRYLTGERISHWVYYVRHRIAQVGGVRFPDGVLLEGINSWIDPRTDLLLMAAADKNDTSRVKEFIDHPLILERLLEFDEMDEQTKQMIMEMAQQYHVTLMKEAARQQAILDSLANVQRMLEQARLDSIAAEQARLDSIAAAQAQLDSVQAALRARELFVRDSLNAAEVARKQAIRDSIAARRQAVRDSIAADSTQWQFNRVGVGLRGGVASIMQKTIPAANGRWLAGFDILAEAQYAHYWQRKGQPAYGVLTGLSLGYTRNGVTAQGNREFGVIDEYGDSIHYTISGADAKEKDGTLMLEIPAMFSMIILDQIFVNVGPRFSIPLFSHYSQDLSKATIEYKNLGTGVPVTDELITGKMNEGLQHQHAATKLSRLNIQLSAEVGYEYKLPIGHIIGVGAYANYSVYSCYPNDPTGKNLIEITTPSSDSYSLVSVIPTTEAYVQKDGLGFFDCGVKVIYHFMMW